MTHLPPGNYIIHSGIDVNIVNTCPQDAPADIVVLNNAITVVNIVGTPSDTCVRIQISGGNASSTGVEKPVRSIPDAPDLWEIKQHIGNLYTIYLCNKFPGPWPGETLAWTDPGGEPSCERRIILLPLRDPPPQSQLFRFEPMQ